MEQEKNNEDQSNIVASLIPSFPSTSTQQNDQFSSSLPVTMNPSGSNANKICIKTKLSSSDEDNDDDELTDGSDKEDEPLEYTQLEGFDGQRVPWNDKTQEKECLSQFLNGELTFSEYAARVDIPDDDNADDGVNNSFVQNILDDLTLAPKPRKNQATKPVAKRSRKKYVRRNLPPALKGLMGEANLRYARGDKDTAVKICLEIIRQVPTAPEPYHTLAGLYEELGYSDKSLEMSLIAAHLSPSDANQWIHLAEVSYVQGNSKQAITCYTKALRADEKNIEVHFKRAELLEKEGQKSIALKGFSKLLTILDPAKEGEKILELSKVVAEMYHKEKDLLKTRQTLEIAFTKCPSLITSEHVNLLLEVLLSLKDFSSCLEILVQFCDVSVEIETVENGLTVIDLCHIPEGMAIDLKVKLILTLIHLKSLKPVDDLLQSLKAADVNVVGDLYLDVAEAFMSEECYENALPLLESLISSKSYSLPAVWLHYAECLKNLGNVKKSTEAYLQVIEQVPQHNDARLVAAQLLTKLGRRDEAISVLVQDEKCDLLDPDLLYEKCMLLKGKTEHVDNFLAVGQLFLSRHFLHIKRFDELRILSNYRGSSLYKKKIALKDAQIMLGEKTFEEDRLKFSAGKNLPSVEEEWDLFMHMCLLCYNLKKFSLLQRLTFSAQVSDIFSSYSKEIDILCVMSCFYNSDSYLGFNYARHLVLKEMNFIRPWNLFNLVIIRGDDARHNKFVMRLLTRNQAHSMLSLLHANNCLVSGTYKYALTEYVSAYRKEKSPMSAFLIGVTLSQMACQKFSAKKHSLVTQAVAFFSKYRELRGPGGLQEYHYNLGRVYHQLGLLPPALSHYKMALDLTPKFVNGSSETFSLTREAAYNVHLIYMQSGAHDMARMYLEKYVII